MKIFKGIGTSAKVLPLIRLTEKAAQNAIVIPIEFWSLHDVIGFLGRGQVRRALQN